MSKTRSEIVAEIWKRFFDPYLVDDEGFAKFVEMTLRMELSTDKGIQWNDFIPPCVRCVKYEKSCDGGRAYRKGGKKAEVGFTPSKLVCDEIILRFK